MDLSNPTLIITLAITTLTLVVLFAIWQRAKVAKAKKEGEHSTLMDDPRATHTETRRVER